jgi:hypothetical protein
VTSGDTAVLLDAFSKGARCWQEQLPYGACPYSAKLDPVRYHGWMAGWHAEKLRDEARAD